MSLPEAALIATTLFLAYAISLSVYRLYLHPLAGFPGLKSVAASWWIEFYYDVVKHGMFIWEIEKMHHRYGPVVRVSPDEIHIMDPAFYDTIYTSKKVDKCQRWCNLAAARLSILTTASGELHRVRRSALNPFFSKQSIVKLESVIHSKVLKLRARLLGLAGTDTKFRLDVAFMALTSDIISEYAFATSYNHLDASDFNLAWKDTITKAVSTGALLRQFPSLVHILRRLPRRLMDRSPLQQLARLKRDMRAQIQSIMRTPPAQRHGRTVFHALLASKLPDAEKSLDRLSDEGQILYGAGSETTAKALTTIAFHLLRNPCVLARLRGELTGVVGSGGEVTWTQLEQLPFLTAIIAEGLRLAGGVTTRTPRILLSPLAYGHHIIPAGTPVSQTGYLVLMDPSIFPSPHLFRPERWMQSHSLDSSASPRLDKYMVAFSKGSRGCLGINLAYAELFLTVAVLFGGVMMELDEGTGEEDVSVGRDFFVGAAREGRGEVWARVVGLVKGV